MILTEMMLAVMGLMIIAASIGLWRFQESENIVYAHMHISGVIDVVCIYLMWLIGQPLIALIYIIFMPISVHAIANAKYYGGR